MDSLELNLKPEHEARYQEIIRLRLAICGTRDGKLTFVRGVPKRAKEYPEHIKDKLVYSRSGRDTHAKRSVSSSVSVK